MTTTDTANFLSMNGRGGRILHLNIISDRDFKLASDHVSCINCLLKDSFSISMQVIRAIQNVKRAD